MFYEKLDIKIDIEKLQKAIIENVFTLGDQVIQGKEYETSQYKGFGGWSIQSRFGDWKDGWETIQTEKGQTLEQLIPIEELVLKAHKHFNIAHSLEYDKPTQACVGEIEKILNQIEELGLTPRRARVTCLKSGCKSLVHKDAETSEYMARLHIPIFSNDKCVFIADGEHLYMEPGSVYLVWVNIWHQIRNDSNQDRYHIIMDAYDTKKITEHFKYEGDIEELKTYARQSREQIDGVDLTEEEITFLEAIKARYITNK